MRKGQFALLLCLAPLGLLVACGNREGASSSSSNTISSSASSSSSSLPVGQKKLTISNVNQSLPLADRNGDEVLSGYKDYTETSSFFSVKESIEFAQKGGSVFFMVASDQCSHCAKFEPIMFEALRDNTTRIGSLYHVQGTNDGEYSAGITMLKNAYGDDTYTGVDGATPRFYHLSKDGCEMLDFYSANDNAAKFKRYLSLILSENNIFHFSSFASYSKGLETFPDALTFVYDYSEEGSLDFYMNSLYEKAKISAKTLLLLDYRLFDEDNRQALSSHFGVSSLTSSIILDGEIKTIKNEAEGSASLIEKYY